jgi:hypothetical protein
MVIFEDFGERGFVFFAVFFIVFLDIDQKKWISPAKGARISLVNLGG